MEITQTANTISQTDRFIGNAVGGCYCPYPWFFASISSVKTNLNPCDYLHVINSLHYDKLLISAYDLAFHSKGHKKEISSELTKAVSNGRITLMDSGNYERYWYGNKEWTKELFEKIAKPFPCTLTFSYDTHFQEKSSDAAAKRISNSVKKSQKFLDPSSIIPIVHAPADQLPIICRKVCQILNPFTIAVAERELGQGILERARTVKSIRRSLDETGLYYPLHVLGTGHPLSLLILTAAGADSFDGLEWCQTTVNHSNGNLMHFQLRELLNCDCPYCLDSELDYIIATLAHNLHFYTRWMSKLQPIINSKKGVNEYGEYLSKNFRRKLLMAIA